jgi:hypothetical protein
MKSIPDTLVITEGTHDIPWPVTADGDLDCRPLGHTNTLSACFSRIQITTVTDQRADDPAWS